MGKKIELYGDAEMLLNDFIYASKRDPETVADALGYDYDGFKNRLRALISQIGGDGEH